MSISKKSILILLSAGALISGAAQATLIDRGGGLLYDNVLNVTWLQDANYAKTSGYSDTGIFDHIQATSWASMNTHHYLLGLYVMVMLLQLLLSQSLRHTL